jgi:diguanylate cyclase (GGDEF)-like protein
MTKAERYERYQYSDQGYLTNMAASLTFAKNSMITRSARTLFHKRSLDLQRTLCNVIMIYGVLAFLLMSCVRELMPGTAGPLSYRIGCAIGMSALTFGLRWARTPLVFGAVGVAYILLVVFGINLNISGAVDPLLWILPSALIIPVCAAPFWLTPTHYVIGNSVFYFAGWFLALRPVTWSYNQSVAFFLWVTIGISVSALLKFGFYGVRLRHFLQQEKINELTTIDALTGLNNRQAFCANIEERLAHNSDAISGSSLIVLTIDHMKAINERYGYAAGDRILRSVAELIADVGKACVVGRLGGKKFGIFVSGRSFDDAFTIADALRRKIAVTTRPDAFLTGSIGIAEHLQGDILTTLLDRADEASHRAKRMGGDRVTVAKKRIESAKEPSTAPVPFSPESAVPTPQWNGHTLLSHFQPLYSLSHQKVVGFEALVRGLSNAGDLVAPQTLFDRASDSDPNALDTLTHELHLGTAKQQLPADSWLFINLLPSTFIHPGYVDHILEIVRRYGLLPSNIVLEILESQEGDINVLADASHRYRDAGFLVAIDDFGSGHSNIDRLLRIQPDIVKLDGTLTRARCRTTSRPLLPNLVSMLHSAGMLVVIEGVETNDELVLAVEANVDLVQGYLLARPSPLPTHSDIAIQRVRRAFEVASETRHSQRYVFETKLRPYLDAVHEASALFAIRSKGPINDILRKLDLFRGWYLLDDSGRSLDHSPSEHSAEEDAPRFPHLASAEDVRWDNKRYFMEALATPGRPVYSEPFFSLTSGRACVAIACAVRLEDRYVVLVAELDWTSPQLPWPNVGTA